MVRPKTGRPWPLNDPYADRLREHALRGGTDAPCCCRCGEFFGELPDQPRFVAEVSTALANIYRLGARAALLQVLATAEPGHVLGIDLGTSEVKVLLIDAAQRIVASAHAPLAISRPHLHWSEQDPAGLVAGHPGRHRRIARSYPRE